jgi:hypothetical protein
MAASERAYLTDLLGQGCVKCGTNDSSGIDWLKSK